METNHYKGFSLIPEELSSEFIDFVLMKKFKLIDESGSIIIGDYGQKGLKGIGCKLDLMNKSVILGTFLGNQLESDGIHYE